MTMASPIKRFAPPVEIPEAETPEEEKGAEDASSTLSKARNFWRRGLLLTSSAALGGIAVAIWNRRGLARIRQKYESKAGGAEAHDEGVQ